MEKCLVLKAVTALVRAEADGGNLRDAQSPEDLHQVEIGQLGWSSLELHQIREANRKRIHVTIDIDIGKERSAEIEMLHHRFEVGRNGVFRNRGGFQW